MEKRLEEIIIGRKYIVTEEGTLLNPSGLTVGTYIGSNGYYVFSIRMKGKKTQCPVHRIQAYQKYGNKLFEDGIVVRHFNGNSLDNSWSNILIGSQSDNMYDIPEQIRIKKARYATSFVRKYDKKEIRDFHNIEKSYKLTMEKFNISSKGTLNYILKNDK